MSIKRKPIPKSQSELSQDSIDNYTNRGKAPVEDRKNRGLQRSVKGDDVKQFSIGLRDIDETIVYYFNNVIKPSVIKNGKRIPVPILYGSPERWASVQRDGFYRDKNGKIQTPLIMFKRDSIEKNRNIGNKMDANNPNNFGIFKKKYSKKNVYDTFSVLTNRIPVEEYYGVIIPDYVNISYSCVIFTDYVEQMNKIVESINFASDAYWGDPERFKFRAMIDNYTTSTELNQGEDRTVKTSFVINLLGHIVPDSINTSVANMNKFYSKSAINFGIEVAGTLENLAALVRTPEKEASNRFFDADQSRTTINQNITQNIVSGSGMTPDEREYLALNTVIDTNTNAYSINTALNYIDFLNMTIADPPPGFPALEVEDFQVYINGLGVEPSAITSIAENGANVRIQFNSGLEYNIVNGMEIVSIGKYVV